MTGLRLVLALASCGAALLAGGKIGWAQVSAPTTAQAIGAPAIDSTVARGAGGLTFYTATDMTRAEIMILPR